MIWNSDVECKDAAELRQQQTKDLVKLIEKVYEKVPFYKKKIDEHGVKPVDIQLVVVLGIGDGGFEDLFHFPRDPPFGKPQIGQRRLAILAANALGHEIELAPARAQVLGVRHRLVVAEPPFGRFLAHAQPLRAFLSAACPKNVRVGENSPNLWPTMFSVTRTGTNLWPL